MKRREFMKLLGAAGMVATASPVTRMPTAMAAQNDHYWITIHAGGGWDPTSLCDPKGDAPREDGRGPVNHYQSSAIKRAGNIAYSPYPEGMEDPGVFDTFFNNHANRLMVINGINNGTVSHSVGARAAWSGKTVQGTPSLAALMASIHGPQLPLAYVSNGGYDVTDSLVATSRVSNPNLFKELAYPNQPSAGDERYRYFEKGESNDVYQLIEEAREKRLQRQIDEATLPKRRRAMNHLFTVKDGDKNLDSLISKLPSKFSSGLMGQAEITAAALAAGVAVSANLSSGGFDTHGNHDRSHYASLQRLLAGINHLWNELERHGIQDKSTILVGSEFGRTPFYNTRAGKDHWSITSMMLMGKGIRGNRVVGATDADYKALKVNPRTLKVDPNGVELTPGHINRALRVMAGIDSNRTARLYPIASDLLPLFG